MELFAVRNPGPMTTVQDLGRLAFLDRGVPLSGALDPFACRVANLLVGNPEEAAVLEITVMGPTLEVLAPADIALTGAEMGMTINRDPVRGWRTVRVNPGDIIRIPTGGAGLPGLSGRHGGHRCPPDDGEPLHLRAGENRRRSGARIGQGRHPAPGRGRSPESSPRAPRRMDSAV